MSEIFGQIEIENGCTLIFFFLPNRASGSSPINQKVINAAADFNKVAVVPKKK